MGRAYYENEADVKDYIFVNRSTHENMAAHFHHNVELVFVLYGTLRVTVGGEERLLTRGGLAISSDCDVHYYDGRGDESFVLVAGGKYMAGVHAEFGGSFVRFLDCEAHFDEIYEILNTFYTEFDRYTDLEKLAAVAKLFGYLARFYDLKGEKRRANHTMVEAMRYMGAHYGQPLTVGDLANRFGYTKTHFSMLFNRFTGTNFRSYLNALRVEAVERAVLEGVPVTKAALLHGFDSLNTFYRARNRQNRNF